MESEQQFEKSKKTPLEEAFELANLIRGPIPNPEYAADIKDKIAALNLSDDELVILNKKMFVLPGEIKLRRNYLKAEQVIKSVGGKEKLSRKDLLKIASLPITGLFHHKLGIKNEVDQIYIEARKKLLESGFAESELAKTSPSEMVGAAFMEEMTD